MSLLRMFPNELLICISEFLEEQVDLNAFTLVNCRLYHLLNNSLYLRNIHDHQSSALVWAAYMGRIGIATAHRLLHLGADTNCRGFPETPLEAAVDQDNDEFAEMLLKAGSNPNAVHLESTALILAVRLDNIHMVDLLLKYGANANMVDHAAGNTALHIACVEGFKHVAKLLIDAGANRNLRSGIYGTPLLAAMTGPWRIEMVELLLEEGVDVASTGALTYAASRGYMEVVKKLLEYGAGASTREGHEWWYDAIEEACGSNGRHILRVLEDREHREKSQVSVDEALQIAAHWKSLPAVHILLSAGANANAQVGPYGTPLQAACHHKWILEILLQHGADVNAQSTHFGTALNAAIMDNNSLTVRFLLNNGADANLRSAHNGWAALDAVRAGEDRQIRPDYAKIIKLLFKHGADANILDDSFQFKCKSDRRVFEAHCKGTKFDKERELDL